MKKIILMLMPLFVVIAIIFSYQGRDFSSFTMLEVFSSWRFDNGWALLVDTKDAFVSVSNSFDSLGSSANLFELVSNIGRLLSSFVVGVGTLIRCLAWYFVDLLHNLGMIVEYLFG